MNDEEALVEAERVLLSTKEYQRLKRRDRQVLGVADFTQEDIDAIERAVAPAEATIELQKALLNYSAGLGCAAN